MLLLSAIREYENDLEQSSREKAEPRTIHYFLAFKRQPLITLKQCMLAVVIARASSASPVLSRSDHTPLIRQMSRQVKELYFPDHTPKMARCIMTRSATWVSRGQFNELLIIMSLVSRCSFRCMESRDCLPGSIQGTTAAPTTRS